MSHPKVNRMAQGLASDCRNAGIGRTDDISGAYVGTRTQGRMSVRGVVERLGEPRSLALSGRGGLGRCKR